jgi:hypothetical protein
MLLSAPRAGPARLPDDGASCSSITAPPSRERGGRTPHVSVPCGVVGKPCAARQAAPNGRGPFDAARIVTTVDAARKDH